ncbi:MAG: hypothetical protein KKE44_20065 [Proteobacteria bacterium]|nr:hypothetical protein [Pseudomonadota bacterium]MBU1585028.1 hypothetical protein [Pseudomonadota bacterium]MBU2629033.1 hypothetical protein [Pseudomonadota bacterium]
MKHLTWYWIKRLAVFIFSTVILFGFSDNTAASDSVVKGTVKQGDAVSATPITIPRTVRLEKFINFVPINKNQALTSQALDVLSGSIDGCDLVTVRGNEMVLSLHYRIAPSVTGVVYSGAYLYDVNQPGHCSI